MKEKSSLDEFAIDFLLSVNCLFRPSTSPSKMRSDGLPHSLAPQKSSLAGNGVNIEVDLSKPMNFPVSKRTKFPSVPSSGQVHQGDSNHVDDDIQR